MNSEISTFNYELKFLKYLMSEISEIQSIVFGQIQSPFHTFASKLLKLLTVSNIYT